MTEESRDLQRLDQAFRELPLRHAPSTLESRVLGELARREQLAWWLRSFAHWPAPARAGFIAVCCCTIVVACVGLAAGLDAMRSLSLTHHALATAEATMDVAAVFIHMAPPAWAYAALMLGGVLYAVLFGLAALLYHSLYLQSTAGD